MSEENVEIVRRAFQYLVSGRGGSEVQASFDPDVVMKPVETGETFGVSAIRHNFERWQSTFDECDVTVDEIIDAGDRVVHCAHWRGRGKGSGIEIDARYYEVYALRDGKIIRVGEYTERAEGPDA